MDIALLHVVNCKFDIISKFDIIHDIALYVMYRHTWHTWHTDSKIQLCILQSAHSYSVQAFQLYTN